MQRKQRKVSGFTLVELMVVIVILGIIGTIAFVFVMDNPDKAKWEKARTEIGEIQKALNLYATSNDGDYPEDLEAIADKMPGGKVPVDPFTKEAYTYEITETGFLITCLGKDGSEGGDEVPNTDILCDERGFIEGE